MRQKTHQVSRTNKPSNIVYVKVDPFKVPSRELFEARRKNRAVTFEDRRFKKPKYKKNYMED